jgi:hypothetical protein
MAFGLAARFAALSDRNEAGIFLLFNSARLQKCYPAAVKRKTKISIHEHEVTCPRRAPLPVTQEVAGSSPVARHANSRCAGSE